MNAVPIGSTPPMPKPANPKMIRSRGEAEIGVAQASEIVPVAGAQLVGPLPGEFAIECGGRGAILVPANMARFDCRGADSSFLRPC